MNDSQAEDKQPQYHPGMLEMLFPRPWPVLTGSVTLGVGFSGCALTCQPDDSAVLSSWIMWPLKFLLVVRELASRTPYLCA